MNPISETVAPDAAEHRLQRNREILRQHLTDARAEHGPLAAATELARLAAPVASELVRQHPAATLSGAALLGVWLVRIKPWQFLGSSMVAGLIARQAVSWSLTSGRQFVSQLATGALSGAPRDRTPEAQE